MVSIIIPVYNVENFLEQCLKSILNQTYKNYEVIIVDDGSTDNSLSIIKKYSLINEKIKIFTQKNKGVSDARNLALSKVVGEFIMFLDPDDYIEKNYIEKMVNCIKLTDSDMVICSYKKVFDGILEGTDEIINVPLDDNKIYTGEEVAEKMLERSIGGYLWDKIFRKSNLINSNFHFESGRYIQDFFPVFRQVLSCKKISIIQEPLYNYRQRVNSAVYTKTLKRIDDYNYAVNNILRYSLENKLNIRKIILFNLETFNIIINDYYDSFGKVKKEFYSNFYKYNLGQNEPSISKIIIANNVNLSIRIKLILWKIRLFRIIKVWKNKGEIYGK